MNKEQLEIYKRAAQKSDHVVRVDAERLLAIIALAEQSLATAAPHAQAPAHETIVQQGDELVCTACGTTKLAQPVDLSKLTRYGFDGTLGGDFGTNNLGPYVKLSDVEQIIAASQHKCPDCKGTGIYEDAHGSYECQNQDHIGGQQAAEPVAFVPPGYTNETDWLRQQLADAKASIKAHQSVLAAKTIQQSQNERAAFEAWAKYCGLRLDMATHQFAWEGWKARATTAEAKLEAIRETVKSLVGYGDEHASFISRANVLALFEPKPQTGRVSYQDCGTGTQSVRQLAASMIQLNEPECELAFVENGRRINIYVKILRVLEQESDESGLPG